METAPASADEVTPTFNALPDTSGQVDPGPPDAQDTAETQATPDTVAPLEAIESSETVEPIETVEVNPTSDVETDADHDVGPMDVVTAVEGPCVALNAVISTSATSGHVPLTVTFDAGGSCTPNDVVGSWWSFGVDGEGASGTPTTFTFLVTGTYTVTLTLTDSAGEAHATTTQITVWPGLCPSVLDPVTLGTLTNGELDEPSGLAASTNHADVLWTHNDSGGEPKIYATDPTGQSLGTFELTDATHVDWEDIALGTDLLTGLSTLYIWDGGDNDGTRESVQVFMLPEPSADILALEVPPALVSTSLDLTYPDGQSLNSDTLMFDPQTGDLIIVAMDMETRVSHVFQKPAPHIAGSSTTLTEVATLTFGEAPLEGTDYPTGGSFSPHGDRILLRTKDTAFLWLRDGNETLTETFGDTPCEGPFSVESGGESIEFSVDGLGYHSLVEAQYGAMLYTEFAEACDQLEARLFVSPSGALYAPVAVTFEVDDSCIPFGLAAVEWVIGGTPTSVESPAVVFNEPGPVKIDLTVMDTTGKSAATTRTIDILPSPCPWPGTSETWGEVELDEINEASGIAVGAKNETVLWTHNDSGDSARFFAMGFDGEDLGNWNLDTSIKDWEDLTTGYDDALQTEAIYIGDVGDNAKSRDHVTIYIVPEPTVDLDEGPTSKDISAWHEITLTYPEGASHNCETLMRDPSTGDLYLVTKSSDGISPVFRKPAPHIHESETELEWVAELVFGEAPLTGSTSTTAGAFSPSGDRIIIRTYTDAWVWMREPDQTVADALGTEACNAQAPDETQGEAICFAPGSDGYITVSEGTFQPIYYTPLD